MATNYASSFNFESEYEHETLGTLYVHAVGGITQFHPATMYRSNGDPGDPADGGECQYDELIVENENGDELDFDEVIGDWDWLDQEAIDNSVDAEDMYDEEGFLIDF